MPIYGLGDREPEVPPSDRFWVAPDAHLIGTIAIGDDVGIWFGAVLRGDNEMITVGAGSNVQEGCVLHADNGFPLTIGEGCTIGHRAVLHGCTIGENCLVGMGAIILNGAHIGADCLVGAGSLVTEGKKFPNGSLIVGSPAKVIRLLDDAEIQSLREAAEDYRAWKNNVSLKCHCPLEP